MTDRAPQKVEDAEGLDPMQAMAEERQPMMPWARATDPEQGEQPSSSVFNRGPRPVQDAGFGALYLGLMALMLLRVLWVFFWPVASLSLVRSVALAVPPLLGLALGLFVAFRAGISVFLLRGITASFVKRVLVALCAGYFLEVVPLLAMIIAEVSGQFSGPLETRWDLAILALSIPLALVGAAIGGLFSYILYYSQGVLPFVALTISDTAKFVLARKRGLLLPILALTAATLSLSVPIMSIASQVARVCPSLSLVVEDGGGGGWGAEGADALDSQAVAPAAAPQPELCTVWEAALDTKSASDDLFTLLGYFMASWSATQVFCTVHFIAAHVIGQCYGSTLGSTMGKDDFKAVIAATKCALYESFGTISLTSLVYAVAFPVLTILFYAGFLLMPILFPCLLPLIAFLALPAFRSLLSWLFLLPMAAFTGQSFSDAWQSSAALVQRATVAQAGPFMLSSIFVVKLLLGIPAFLYSFFALQVAAQVEKSVTREALPSFGTLMAVIACSAPSIMLQEAFLAACSSVYLGLAMEGKAVLGRHSTPLVTMNA